MRRWRQNRWPVRRGGFLLYFEFGGEDRRSGGGNRHRAGLCSTITVENLRGIAGGHNLRQRSQRSTHNIDAANQFIRPPVSVHLVDYERFHLKSLRLAAAGERKSAGNVVDQ